MGGEPLCRPKISSMNTSSDSRVMPAFVSTSREGATGPLLSCANWQGGQPERTSEPGMVSAVEVEVYSNIALRPFMSCPVVCRMISAGITEASMSQQPGLMPAAVGSGGSDLTAKSLYLTSAPVLPAGWSALTYPDILVPAPVPWTSGRSQLDFSCSYMILLRCAIMWSEKDRFQSVNRQRPAMKVATLNLAPLGCGISMRALEKYGSQRMPSKVRKPVSPLRPTARHSVCSAKQRISESCVPCRRSAEMMSFIVSR